MNALNKNRDIQNRLAPVRNLWQTIVKVVGVGWVTVTLIILFLPQPGITVAPGGCSTASGECSTSINL